MVVGGYVGTLGYWRTPPHRLINTTQLQYELKLAGKESGFLIGKSLFLCASLSQGQMLWDRFLARLFPFVGSIFVLPLI